IRTTFTLLSIFVSFVLFGYLMAVRSAFNMGVELTGADRLMVLNKISLIMPLPGSYMEKARAIDGVKDVTHANWFGGYFQDAKKIDDLFANSPTETKTDSEKNFVAGWAKQIGNISLITQLVAAAAIFMMLLVTANTMAQSIRERTSEMAVLKTLGFGDGRVLSMVLMESCVLALVGGLSGLAVGWLLVSLGDPTGSYLTRFRLPPGDIVVGVAIAIALGFAAGAVPAWQAGRLRIVDALRRS